jgi:O-antigen ligase
VRAAVATPVATATFGLLGVAIAVLGPQSPLILAPVVAVWAIVGLARIGTGPVVTAALLAVAVTAPLNGVRAFRALALTDVMLTAAVLALAVEQLLGRRPARPLPAGFILGTALVVAGGLVGTLFAESPPASLAHLLPFTLAATVPVFIVRLWGPSLAQLRRYAWFWVAGATVSGVVGLLSTGGLTGRPGGLTPHPNHLALTCALGAGLALVLWLGGDGWRRHLALAFFGVLAVTVVRSGSRAGLIGLLVTTAVIIVRTRDLRPAPERIGRGALAVLALALVVGGLIGSGAVRVGEQNAVQRLLGDASARAADAERVTALEQNVRKIGDRPLTGNGFEEARQAHNIYIQVWAAAGVPGLIGFLMLVVAVVREGAREVPGAGAESRYIRTAFLAGYLGYLVAGLAQNVLWDRYIWLHVAVILWARAAAPSQPTPEERAVPACA